MPILQYSLKRLVPQNLRSIPSLSLLAHQIQEQINGFILAFKMVSFALPSPTNPAPGPGQTGFTKQCVRNFHGVVAGHVFRGFGAFDIDVIGLRDHTDRFGYPDPGVQ